MDEGGPLCDLHMLDTRDLIWWQLHASGEYPTARHSHAAELLGRDFLYVGGSPPGSGMSYLLSTDAMERRTTAQLEPFLSHGDDLYSSCLLLVGTIGSPSQLWSCGPQLSDRSAAANLTDSGEDYIKL